MDDKSVNKFDEIFDYKQYIPYKNPSDRQIGVCLSDFDVIEIKQAILSWHNTEIIKERLNIRAIMNAIHYKYPNDDANSDRLFRNEFMSEFSKFMDETTEMIKNNEAGES
jgi:hypothetical protein